MSQAAAHVGESQWKLIGREFLKRRLAVLSAGVILFLIQAAIWAPFLANDRPLYYVGANRFAYSESLRTCQGAMVQLINHLKETPQDRVPAVVDKALGTHLPLMRRQLTPEASLKVRKGNYVRIFDEGRRRVRQWEQSNVQ